MKKLRDLTGWKRWLAYLVLVATMSGSFVIASDGRFGWFFSTVSSLPGVMALIVFVQELVMDNVAHARELEKQDRNNEFQLGATSHMAIVAFDKHVEFCEEYVHKVYEVADALIAEGPDNENSAWKAVTSLQEVRRKYTIWVTADLSDALFPFEEGVRILASNATKLKVAIRGGHTIADELYEKIDANWADLLGALIDRTAEDGDRSVNKVIEQVRGIIGVDQLTSMRSKLVINSSK